MPCPFRPFAPRALLAGAALLAVTGLVTLGRADPPAAFTAGERLSAGKLNASFQGLDQRASDAEQRLAAMDTKMTALEARLAAAEKNQVPPGTVVAFGGENVPEGWLLCDGRELVQKDDPKLFAAIGIAYGSNGPTVFNVPDLRGRFVRGVDRKSGRDPDRDARTPSAVGGAGGDAVGSLQLDGTRSHTHAYAITNATGVGLAAGGVGVAVIASITATATGAAGGNETRPTNVAVNYIIKRY